MGAGATPTPGHCSDVLDEFVRCVRQLRQEGTDQWVRMSFISQDKVLVGMRVIHSLLCTCNAFNKNLSFQGVCDSVLQVQVHTLILRPLIQL